MYILYRLKILNLSNNYLFDEITLPYYEDVCQLSSFLIFPFKTIGVFELLKFINFIPNQA